MKWYNKTQSALSFLVLALSLLISVSCTQKETNILVYGADKEPAFVQAKDELSVLLKKHPGFEASEILVMNGQNTVLITKDSSLSTFDLVRESNKFCLLNDDSKKLVSDITCIYFPPQTRDTGFYHLDGTEEIAHYDVYQLIKSNLNISVTQSDYSIGTLNDNYKSFTITTKSDSLLMIYASGVEQWYTPKERGILSVGDEIQLTGDHFVFKDQVLKGIWENPPAYSNRDIYPLLKKTLENEPVMAIFVDALGYNLWQYAKSINATGTYPQMEVHPARAVFPPRTIYNYHMFGTGSLLNDGYSPAKMIFADPIFAEKKGKIIEGQVQVYSSPLEHKLNVPEKTDNNVDRIIFETAKAAIKDGSEFLFIHFEEVDDIGHARGPHSEEAIRALNNVGYYITELQKLWTGKIFIFSDHGMHPYYNHETSKIQGTHNSATIDDIVPIFIELQ